LTRIHPTAVIDPTARLAEDVEIGPYAVIEGAVNLDAGCVLRPHAHLIGPLKLGRNNIVHSGAVLGERAQHLRYDGPNMGVIIGDDNVFREHVTIHSGTVEHGTRIGHRNYFMASSHVAHDCEIGNQCIFANGALLAGHVNVADSVFMSGISAVHQFTCLGRLSMMSGGATTSKDVPPFFVQEGRNRAVGVNVVGMKRVGLGAEQIDAVREAYRMLYLQRKVLPAAVETIERHLGHVDVVAELIAFIRASKRGITFTCGYRAAA
jgi:UDP-N-acetylglucosamine acyltransferase